LTPEDSLRGSPTRRTTTRRSPISPTAGAHDAHIYSGRCTAG
jgi:hypothetical protein